MGRRPLLDRDKALGAAMHAFWTHGYEGTSVSSICDTIGSTKPSLYRVFGSKTKLFASAVEYYERTYLGFFGSSVCAPTVEIVVARLLDGMLTPTIRRDILPGSLLLMTDNLPAPALAPIRALLLHRQDHYLETLRLRFVRAEREGDLPAMTDPRVLARLLMTMFVGLAHQAKAGAALGELNELIHYTRHHCFEAKRRSAE